MNRIFESIAHPARWWASRQSLPKHDIDFFKNEALHWEAAFKDQAIELAKVRADRDMYRSILDFTVDDTVEMEQALHSAVMDNDRYSTGKVEGLRDVRRSIQKRRMDLGLIEN